MQNHSIPAAVAPIDHRQGRRSIPPPTKTPDPDARQDARPCAGTRDPDHDRKEDSARDHHQRLRRGEAYPPGRPHPRDGRHRPHPRGRPLRRQLAELHRVVRPQHGAVRRVHRHPGRHPRAGPGHRHRRHRHRRPARCGSGGRPVAVGPEDRHGPAAAGPAPLRQVHLGAGPRPVALGGGLGCTGRPVRWPGRPDPLPRALRRRGAGRAGPGGPGRVPGLRVHPPAGDLGRGRPHRPVRAPDLQDPRARRLPGARHRPRRRGRGHVLPDDDHRLLGGLQLGHLRRRLQPLHGQGHAPPAAVLVHLRRPGRVVPLGVLHRPARGQVAVRTRRRPASST